MLSRPNVYMYLTPYDSVNSEDPLTHPCWLWSSRCWSSFRCNFCLGLRGHWRGWTFPPRLSQGWRPGDWGTDPRCQELEWLLKSWLRSWRLITNPWLEKVINTNLIWTDWSVYIYTALQWGVEIRKSRNFFVDLTHLGLRWHYTISKERRLMISFSLIRILGLSLIRTHNWLNPPTHLSSPNWARTFSLLLFLFNWVLFVWLIVLAARSLLLCYSRIFNISEINLHVQGGR